MDKLHIHKPDPTIGLQTIIPYGRDNYKKIMDNTKILFHYHYHFFKINIIFTIVL